MHARAFVFALDNITNILRKLAEEPGVPPDVPAARDDLVLKLPMVKDLRDSLHHVEDRGRGKWHGSAIVAAPITTGPLQTAGGGLMVLEDLSGSTFSGTAGSGAHASVDVTWATLEIVRDTIQKVLNAFAWEGDSRHLPS